MEIVHEDLMMTDDEDEIRFTLNAMNVRQLLFNAIIVKPLYCQKIKPESIDSVNLTPEVRCSSPHISHDQLSFVIPMYKNM